MSTTRLEGAQREIDVWYGAEAHYLEVTWRRDEGFYQETKDERVMKRVDMHGELLGFSIMGLHTLDRTPLRVAL